MVGRQHYAQRGLLLRYPGGVCAEFSLSLPREKGVSLLLISLSFSHICLPTVPHLYVYLPTSLPEGNLGYNSLLASLRVT